MRGAMVGLGVGMLTSLGLHALFGNRHHDMEGEVAEQETQAVVEEERQGLDIVFFAFIFLFFSFLFFSFLFFFSFFLFFYFFLIELK